MNTKHDIEINSRYYLRPIFATRDKNFNVIDRARELRGDPNTCLFSNGSEAECREWVLRNCEEPVEHTPGPWKWWDRKSGRPLKYDLAKLISGESDQSHNGETIFTNYGGAGICALGTGKREKANAALIKTAPKLLALLEQYHQSFPSKESGKLICEARNWTI